MLDAQALADRYVDAWNESDPTRRPPPSPSRPGRPTPPGERAPRGYERAHLEAHPWRVRKSARRAREGVRFRAAPSARQRRDVVTFRWEMLLTDSERVLASGLEFLIVDDDGRILVDHPFAPRDAPLLPRGAARLSGRAAQHRDGRRTPRGSCGVHARARSPLGEPNSPHLAADRTGRDGAVLRLRRDRPLVSPEMRSRLQQAVSDSKGRAEVEIYPGVNHGFAFPQRSVYDKPASERHSARLFWLFEAELVWSMTESCGRLHSATRSVRCSWLQLSWTLGGGGGGGRGGGVGGGGGTSRAIADRDGERAESRPIAEPKNTRLTIKR